MEQPSLPLPEAETFIKIYTDNPWSPHWARKDVCVARSGWMAAALRCQGEQEQMVRIDGLDPKASTALVAYFQINSTPIRSLPRDDRQMLTDIFQLHHLERDKSEHQELLGESSENTKNATTEIDDATTDIDSVGQPSS